MTLITRIRRRLGRVYRSLSPASVSVPHVDFTSRRAAMTLGCRDSDSIPKVAEAGEVIDRGGRQFQVMHEGTLVEAGCYYGDWMTRIIRGLKGHHEPQEELIFHHLVAHCRPGTAIMEVGAFWAYYSNWYLGAVPGSTAVCVEPDANHMACGQRNLAINGRSATWVNACVGREVAAAVTIRRESDGATVSVPCHSFDSLLDLTGRQPIEMLHIDCQGAELPLLESLGAAVRAGLMRFVFVSTHQASISGSPTTHQDCLRVLEDLGATILCEHSVEESFSGDGLIAASFSAQDAKIDLPVISRNEPQQWMLGNAARRPVVMAATQYGPMLVYEDDVGIGQALREQGRFEEGMVSDAVKFLRRSEGFRPRLLVDIGANIGTHLLRGLRDGTFLQGVGVEMDRDNFRLLVCNVHLAECQGRARLFNAAVSDVGGSVTMEVAVGNFGDHRVRLEESTAVAAYDESDRETRTVPAMTLDAVEAASGTQFDDRTLIWVDTQGHEGNVLASAERIMARDRRPYVAIEFWPYGLERSGGHEKLFQFLRRCRVVYDMRSKGWEDRPPVSVPELESLYHRTLSKTGDEKLEFTDLLCMP